MGHFCGAGSVVGEECPKDTHGGGLTGLSSVFCNGTCPTDQTPLGPRQRVTLGTGTVDASGCLCQPGFFMDASGACAECETGTECMAPGVTLAGLPLSKGYWRVTAESKDVRLCNYEAACSGGAVNASALGASDIWAEAQCAGGYRGPLCGACADEYYLQTTGACKSCAGGSAWRSWVLIGVVLGAAGLLFGYLLLHGGSRKPPKTESKPNCCEMFLTNLLSRIARYNTKFRSARRDSNLCARPTHSRKRARILVRSPRRDDADADAARHGLHHPVPGRLQDVHS